MRTTRTLRWILFGGAAAGLLLASGAVQVDINVRDNVARAVEAFDPTADGPLLATPALWQEGSGDAAVAPPIGAPPSFADLAERVSPAIVNIQTKKTIGAGGGQPRGGLEEFFGLQPRFRGRREVPSLGTGFVIRGDGFIVTNNHVVADVDEISVHFSDDTVLEAKVIGRDPKTDLALIKVEPEDELRALPFGDSDSMRPGDWVVAIGNPFGLEHTVTAGIISAKHRQINRDESRRFDDFLQTDAAINPGNSGGPLLNLKGEVVGINTAINPRANTIGFAVPINLAKTILPQLENKGRVARGYLGVGIQPIDADKKELLDLEDLRGALVATVEPGSPAERAGIERYDVIVEFNDSPVNEMQELPKLVAATPVGSAAKVVIVRDGKRKTLDVTLAELDPSEIADAEGAEDEETGTYGLAVQRLTPEIAEQLGMEGADDGVIVSSVEPTSPAEEAGLRRGDVIVEVNRHPIDGVAEFRERIGEKKAGAILVVRRGDSEQLVALKPAG
ncbi:MAG: Do family serine endopeptidase [bacterium]|nr:Do family serine endopeptidase [bacterium]